MSDYLFDVGISIKLVSDDPASDEVLDALASSRMGHIEIMHAAEYLDPDRASQVRERVTGRGVRINSVHAPFNQKVDISRTDPGGADFARAEVGHAIQAAQNLGAAMVVLHGSAEPISDEERPVRIAQSRDSLAILAEQAESAGVRLALELLPRTCLGNTAKELCLLVEDLSPDRVGFCLDANHPADPTDLGDIVRTLGDRIFSLHISDYDGIDERHWMPLRGVVDWGAFTNALRDVGYRGAFIYETRPEGETPAERLMAVRTNFDHILQLAKVGKGRA